ncbi:hypothetical protein MKX01_033765 [Papaver californicum]|nr:hypothetical protein MKX01_033765 [Papaver californicum]
MQLYLKSSSTKIGKNPGRFKRVAEAFNEGAKARLCAESSGSEHSAIEETSPNDNLSDLVDSFLERGYDDDDDDDDDEVDFIEHEKVVKVKEKKKNKGSEDDDLDEFMDDSDTKDILKDLLLGFIKMVILKEASRQSLKKNDMHIPPWRRNGYVQEKWLSMYKRTIKSAADMVVSGSGTGKRSVGFDTVPASVKVYYCRDELERRRDVGMAKKVGQLGELLI